MNPVISKSASAESDILVVLPDIEVLLCKLLPPPLPPLPNPLDAADAEIYESVITSVI